MTIPNLNRTPTRIRANFLDEIDGLAKTVEDVIKSLRTTTHDYPAPSYKQPQNLDDFIPDDLVQGYPKEPVLQLVSDYLSQTAADVSLGFTDFKDHRTPPDPVQRNTAWFPHTAQRWKQEHYQKKEAVDESVAELERHLRETAGRKINDLAAQFKPNGSPTLDLERRILGNGTLLPLLQKTRAELYRRAGVNENPLLLYQLCFQKVMESKGWDALADVDLATKLQEEQVPLEVFEEFTKRRLVKVAPAPAPQTGAASSPGIVYTDVIFETRTTYNENGKENTFTFDKSLERLRAAGFARHPRPQEVFSLLIANLEDRLTPEQKAVAQDMLKSYGEWLDLALERNGDILTVHQDIEGLVWKSSTGRYEKQNFRSRSRRNFTIPARINSSGWIKLNQFGDDVVEYLYTRPFAQLPKKMRQGGSRAQLYLPSDGIIWPADRGVGSFDIYCFSYNHWASRGVVPSAQEG